MQRRVLAGAAATWSVFVGAAVADFFLDGEFAPVVFLSGLAGGLVAGLLSKTSGHVGAGVRAGGYGAAVGFLAFLVVGVVQSAVSGDLGVLLLGFRTLLIALLLVPVQALLGAMMAPLGVRIRGALGRETAFLD
ncbi:hypothetical protein [Natronomonas amylolytica]|uniref:hypothetical protein n=1 Tax=Natronomonas amylolytica TaxID=3108498 RepID=UPI0030085F0C